MTVIRRVTRCDTHFNSIPLAVTVGRSREKGYQFGHYCRNTSEDASTLNKTVAVAVTEDVHTGG